MSLTPRQLSRLIADDELNVLCEERVFEAVLAWIKHDPTNRCVSFIIKHFNREFKLRVIRQTANARRRKNLRYQAIKSKLACCFKTEIHNYSFDTRKKI